MHTIYTIASLLDVEGDEKVKNLWEVLENQCSLKGIQLTPLPHISWQASETYKIEDVERYLDEFTQHHKPFTIRTTGLGVFTGEKIILYLAVVQSPHLSRMHKMIWRDLGNFGEGHYYFAPDYWIPHITLANKDVDQQKIACAIGELANRPLNFKINISSIVILYDNQGELGVKSIYKFAGSTNNNRV
jgi:2'-5' RNA ligase